MLVTVVVPVRMTKLVPNGMLIVPDVAIVTGCGARIDAT
jgi:hypothetical protein